MIICRSPLHQQLLAALEAAKEDHNANEWKDLLRDRDDRNSAMDPFLAVLDYGFPEGFHPAARQFPHFTGWLLHAKAWSEALNRPSRHPDIGSFPLYYLWDRFSSTLSRLLRQGRATGALPKKGGVLAYVGGLSKCIIINYDFVGDAPRLQIVSVFDDPKSAFDFWGVIDQADMAARNHLKNILASGHKIIFQRGVLIHVDRHVDTDVFGPSIDTMLLAEILAQELIESNDKHYRTAIDIGCGNGMLTSMLASHCNSLTELFAIDVQFDAIACTRRNVEAPLFGRDNNGLSIYYIKGSFQPDLLDRQFDLVVCNPPYIPLPSGRRLMSGPVAAYQEAVGGIDLLQMAMQVAPTVLAPGGRMLLMTSNLSLVEALSWVPNGLDIVRPLGEQGFEVLFDVEAVLNDPPWLDYLVNERGLMHRGGSYYHVLHPIWLSRPVE